MDIENLWVFRIIHIENLEYDLKYGLHCKSAGRVDPNYINIGNEAIIGTRNKVIVKCFPNTFVNDYVPFYFSKRTPMLYNIHTGYSVKHVPQQNIIYLCCRVRDLATPQFQWCYTNGNAAQKITKFYRELQGVETKVDWHSIKSHDFRDSNADGDEDRKRKKQAEFLVKSFVPANLIKGIVVYDKNAKEAVQIVLKKLGMKIDVHIDTKIIFIFND